MLESLPGIWERITLGDYIDVVRGASPRPKGDPRYFGGDINWISIKDVNAEQGKYLTTTREFVTEAGAEKSRLLPVGSLILSNSASVCIPKILKKEGCIHDGFVTFPGMDKDFNVDFFYHMFNWMRPYVIQANRQGVTQVNLNTDIIRQFRLPISPLAEQKVIADKLDSLLAQVENIKARLDRIPEVLNRFRHSVLAAAVSGKLTEDWREGKPFETEKGELGEFVETDIGQAFKSKEFADEGIPLLRGQNIEPGGLKWGETKYYPEEKLNAYSHLFLEAGDIVLAMDRPIISTGLKLARVKQQDLPCVLVQRVTRFKNYRILCPDYLYLLLSDLSFSNYIQPNQTGSDIPHISGRQILSFPVEVPSPEEQIETVRQVKQLFAYAERTEHNSKQSQECVNKLTQSVLAKAFRGELTENWRKDNSDLISGENSAEALLEKIRIEREKLRPVKKGKEV